MDNPQYHPNALNTNNNSPYSPLPGIAPHQLQQHNNLPPHTLPPLQPQQHAPIQMYNSAPNTPRTPSTPNPPGSANTMGNFPQMGGQSRGYQMMPANNYQQPAQQYRPSPMMPQSSSAMSHPQPIAPAPIQNRGPQALRPMPPNGLQNMQPSLSSPYGPGSMLSQSSMLPEEPPTHVVGSQGRRGVLPSAPGRAPVNPSGPGSSKNAMIPAKDADGKFPCPHCTKTYLHAKHLKRHLLRHTGDRPYMCVLCRDTFSRSDILKRHFQKCSIRRGNPTGASHLSHAQAHLKKSHPGPHKNATMSNNMMGNGINNLTTDPALHPFGVIPDGSIPDAGSNLTDEQASKRITTGVRDRRSTLSSGQGGSSRSSFDQGYPSTMASAMNPSMAYSMPNGQNGHSYGQSYDFGSQGNAPNIQAQSSADMAAVNGRPTMPVFATGNAGQQSSLDWSQMFQQGGQDGFMGQYNPNMSNSQMHIKQEGGNSGVFTGVYPGNAHGLPNEPPTWNIPPNEPLQQISNNLLNFCLPPNSQAGGRNNEVRKFVSADSIQHFLQAFSNFQGHFPIIHTVTFRIQDAYEGLLLAMMCIGAVYSNRLNTLQVREMMELTKMAVERNSQVYAIISREHNGDGGYGNENIGSSRSELEQVTAIYMMQVLFTWHGTPVQREKARRQFPLVISLARRCGLTQPLVSPPFSVLHQPQVSVEHFNVASFDWHMWVEQEKRSRLLFAIYLLDCAMTIYFNIPPMFESYEIRLPLPTDDAAWDAANSTECADALGLHGPAAARDRNHEGSRRPKQPEFHSALRALMHNMWDLQPGTTNLYSKFILIHALHVQLWTAQKQLAQESGQMNPQAMNFSSSAAGTPLSQNDWVRNAEPGSGAPSSNTSGRGTPVSDGQLTQQLKNVSNAFDKWKKIWDEDMVQQYPPQTSHYRRFGFCRDGSHFFWLYKYFISKNYHPSLNMAPDQRLASVMNLLKSAKSFVVPDSAKRGEELGSISDIDQDYGLSDLTLDMAQFFRPINKQIDSPVASVHTNIGNGML